MTVSFNAVQASFFMAMTSDHNRSELGIQDHSNEQSSSKLVPKVVVRLGINPMIQPEPEDLPKDNPKLEIAVLRMKKKCMDKGSKERSPPHNLRQKPGQYICCQNHKLIADIENDIMDPVMQCTTLPSHSGFSQQNFSHLSQDTTYLRHLTPEIVNIEYGNLLQLRRTKTKHASNRVLEPRDQSKSL
ncbi:hypothetical protein Tco_0047735 [Tanacetum coccineum]